MADAKQPDIEKSNDFISTFNFTRYFIHYKNKAYEFSFNVSCDFKEIKETLEFLLKGIEHSMNKEEEDEDESV